MSKKAVLYTLFTLFFVASQPILPASQPKPQEVWVNVFVHGMMSVAPHLRSFRTIINLFNDTIENTVYEKTVEYTRNDTYFFQNQAMQKCGLKKVDPANVYPGNASGAMAAVFNKVNFMVSGQLEQNNYYYTYGWSGLMSTNRRYQDAIDLYAGLKKELALFAQRGIKPKVRLIGYSHGGNVILNLARIRQERGNGFDFYVDELILLGVPILKETDYLVADPLFKKAYHIFSYSDRIQPLDIFASKKLLSSHRIKKRKGFEVPDKLTQIRVKMTRLSKRAQRDPKKTALACNLNNRAVVSGKFHLLKDCSPGHFEWWFLYRKDFLLYPLPIAAFTPIIIKAAESLEHKPKNGKAIIVDIRPEHELILVKNRYHLRDIIKPIRFFSRKTLKKLGNIAMRYQSPSYSNAGRQKHIDAGLDKAVAFFKQGPMNKETTITLRRIEKRRTTKRQARRKRKSSFKVAQLMQPFARPVVVT